MNLNRRSWFDPYHSAIWAKSNQPSFFRAYLQCLRVSFWFQYNSTKLRQFFHCSELLRPPGGPEVRRGDVYRSGAADVSFAPNVRQSATQNEEI